MDLERVGQFFCLAPDVHKFLAEEAQEETPTDKNLGVRIAPQNESEPEGSTDFLFEMFPLSRCTILVRFVAH